MTRKERVKEVHEFINAKGDNENNFDELHSKFLKEFELETEFNPDIKTNRYLWHLRQTSINQLANYLHYQGKKEAAASFDDFVSNFRQDTTWAII